jgi:hypothetical protein
MLSYKYVNRYSIQHTSVKKSKIVNIIVRRNNGEQAKVPFYNPMSLFNAMDRFAGNIRDSSKPYTLNSVSGIFIRTIIMTDLYAA